MQRCTTCLDHKDPNEFTDGSKKCDSCKNRVKLRSTARKSTPKEYNENAFVLGMLVGDHKGLQAYF